MPAHEGLSAFRMGIRLTFQPDILGAGQSQRRRLIRQAISPLDETPLRF